MDPNPLPAAAPSKESSFRPNPTNKDQLWRTSWNRTNDLQVKARGSNSRYQRYPPCLVCGKIGHSKKGCYEIIGYPDWWDHSRNRSSNWKNEGDKNRASGLLTTAGKTDKALHSVSVLNNTWIIDSGATDHMTFDSRQVTSHTPSSQNFVSTANGDPVPVVGKGSIHLSDNLSLDSVLVVPSLDHNLLSVAQITTALNCIVIFWPSHCVFKDIQTRRTIGYGIRRGKLYYLDLALKSTNQLHQVLQTSVTLGKKVEDEIWLWHRRLGHASFSYLKKLFPKRFTNVESSVFRCEVCELAKSHRTSYPPSTNKCSVPFMMIHSDVWGPSPSPSLSGARWFVTFIDDCTRMTWICPMKSKGEVSSLFQRFHKHISTQYNTSIQVL